MRYLFGFLCVCAFGVMPLVGCSESPPPPECRNEGDCDDQNECTNEACEVGVCERAPEYDGKDCDFDGSVDTPFEDGVCLSGVCQENPCDDGDGCTSDQLLSDGSCDHESTVTSCEYGFCDANGSPGVCAGLVCEEYPCNEGVICDDGDLCTSDRCACYPWDWNYGMCDFSPKCRSDECRDASCNPADGSCHYTNKPDGTYCPCPLFLCFGCCWSCQNGECV